VLAFAAARRLGASELKIFSDSELLVRQFNGEYKIKDPALKILMGEIKKESAVFKSVSLSHVRREANSHADRLVNVILDNAGTKAAPAMARSVAKENAQKLHQPGLF
jgi:ribonuclease HI